MNRKIKNYILLLVILLYILFYKFIIFTKVPAYSETITAGFLIILLSVLFLIYGYRKDKKTKVKDDLLKNTIFFVTITFAIMYLLGFFTGFLKNAYSLKINKIFENMLSPIIIIIVTELIRYIFMSSNTDKKKDIILFTIGLILLELTITIRPLSNYNFKNVFEITSSVILPIIIKNASLSYLTYYAGLKSSLIYRLIMDLYKYLLPIFPNLGDYFNSMILITLPIMIYISTSSIVEQYSRKQIKHEFKEKSIKFYDIPLAIIILVPILLTSGVFKYQMLGIGSNSMQPKISRGDAVIIKKIKTEKEIKKGDIIAYKTSDRIIIHRIVKIKTKNNEKIYTTKGDANNTEDNVEIKVKNIKGKVIVKIPYISYPSVFISELISQKG